MQQSYIRPTVATRNGDILFSGFQATADWLAVKRKNSQRQEMLAQVALIEARLELERALKRGAVPMATPVPVLPSRPMATRIRPPRSFGRAIIDVLAFAAFAFAVVSIALLIAGAL